MRILVTRPRADCEEMTRALTEAGHQVLISPMLEIELEPIAEFDDTNLAAIIVTSQNALRSLAESPQLPRLLCVQVFAVGPRTAAVARDLGFQHIVDGPGTGAELAQIIAASALPKGARIVHLAGDTLAFDMEAALSAIGYRAETIRCYRSLPAGSFTAEAEKAIRQGAIDLVTLLSPRTARTFVRLIKSAALEEHARSLSYACISEAARKALTDEGWLRTEVAPSPNGQELLALVNRMAAQSRQ